MVETPKFPICVHCLETMLPAEYFDNDHMHYTCGQEMETFPQTSPSHFEMYRPIDRLEQALTEQEDDNQTSET
jgi:hypothetical protein